MSIDFFVVMCLVLYVLGRWVVFPKLKRSALSDALGSGSKSRAWLAVCGLVSTAALVAAGAAIVFGFVLNNVMARSSLTLDGVRELHQQAEHWLSVLGYFSQGWLIFAAFAALVGLGYYLYRRAQWEFDKAREMLIQREMERIKNDLESGKMEHLPPSDEMQQLLDAARERHQKLQALEELERSKPELRSEARRAISALHEQIDEIIHVVQILDVKRRMNATVDPASISLMEPEGFWEKFAAVFVSRGFVSGLSGTARALLLVLVAFLVPCLVGITGKGMADLMQTRAEQLNTQSVELQFAANLQEARDSYEKAKESVAQQADAPDAKEKKDEDEDLANLAGAQFEAQLLATSGVRPVPPPDFTTAVQRAKAASVREKILENHALRQPGSVDFHANTSPEAKAARESVINMAERAKAPVKPQTAVGKAVAEDLRTLLPKTDSPARAKLRSVIDSMPVKPGDVEWILARERAGIELGHPAATGTPSSITSTWHDASRQEFFSSMAKGDSPGVAFSHASSKSAEHFVDLGDLRTADAYVSHVADPSEAMSSLRASGDRLATQAPTLRPTPNATRDRQMKKVLDSMFAKLGGGDMNASLDRVAYEFHNQFPRTVADAEHGLLGQLHKTWSDSHELAEVSKNIHPYGGGNAMFDAGGGGGKPRAPKPIVRAMPSTKAIAASVTRAGSFGRLRGFARIGGVLIGRPPVGDAVKSDELDITAVDWSFDDQGSCTLTLRTASGKTLKSMPHSAELVYRALSYAADGRPTTVTMVTASPLPELKILVHPALIDSALGNQIIELDRYVDTYARAGVTGDAEDYVHAADALYKLAWAARVPVVVDAIKDQVAGDERVQSTLQMLTAMATSILEDGKTALQASEAFLHPASWLKTHAPLGKSDFYDAKLVTWMEAALPAASAAKDGSAKAFVAEIRGKALSTMSRRSSVGRIQPGERSRMADFLSEAAEEEMLKTFHMPPPEFEIWSGVRESDYVMGAAPLLISSRSELPHSLRFMLQVAFTSAPVFSGKPEDEDYFDESPWEFSEYEKAIRQKIDTAMAEHPDVRNTCERAREFVILQRLFRNALEGRLGQSFPLDRLSVLAEESSKHLPPPVRTPRWNARGGLLEGAIATVIINLAASDDASSAAMAQKIRPLISEREARISKFQTAMVDKLIASPLNQRSDPKWQAEWLAMWKDRQAAEVTWLASLQAPIKTFLADNTLSAEQRGRVERIDELMGVLDLRNAAGVADEEPFAYARLSPGEVRRDLEQQSLDSARRKDAATGQTPPQ